MNIETKSRYEIYSDLQNQKQDLIRQRDGFDDILIAKEKTLKLLRRQLEDAQEDIDNFKKSMNQKKETIETLIKSVDTSLESFSKMQKEK